MTLPNTREIIVKTTGAVFARQEIDAWEPMLTKAMKEYARQVLDYAAEKATTTIVIEPNDQPSSSFGDDIAYVVDKQSILKIKDEL